MILLCALTKQCNRRISHLKVKLANDDLSQDRTTLIMSKVLKSFRVNEIETAVSGLSEKEADLLIKLVYRSFELEPEGPLLQWHSQVLLTFIQII